MLSSGSIRAILLDLDGTLIDSSEDLADSVIESFRGAGFTPPPREKVLPHMGAPLGEMLPCVRPGLTDEDVERIYKIFRVYYPEHWLDRTAPYEGVMGTLHRLAGQYTLAVVTTKRQIQADRLTVALGMDGIFQHVQGWNEGLRHKPNPDLILAALRALHLRPAEAVMVGDTFRDILAGQKAGCSTIAVTYGVGDEKELRALKPDALAHSFAELPDLLNGKM
jgi:phosphoglycolate phosphatase